MAEAKKKATKSAKPERVRIEIKGDPTVPGIANAVKVLKEQGKEIDQVSLARAIDQAVDLVINKR